MWFEIHVLKLYNLDQTVFICNGFSTPFLVSHFTNANCLTLFDLTGISTSPFSVGSIFSPNAGKYGPEKTPYLDPFHVDCLLDWHRYLYKPVSVTLLPLNASGLTIFSLIVSFGFKSTINGFVLLIFLTMLFRF